MTSYNSKKSLYNMNINPVIETPQSKEIYENELNKALKELNQKKAELNKAFIAYFAVNGKMDDEIGKCWAKIFNDKPNIVKIETDFSKIKATAIEFQSLLEGEERAGKKFENMTAPEKRGVNIPATDHSNQDECIKQTRLEKLIKSTL